MGTIAINLDEIDTAVIAYVEWHKHAKCVQIAYDAWLGSVAADRPMRYAAYLEELDREERACELYRTSLKRPPAAPPRRRRRVRV